MQIGILHLQGDLSSTCLCTGLGLCRMQTDAVKSIG